LVDAREAVLRARAATFRVGNFADEREAEEKRFRKRLKRAISHRRWLDRIALQKGQPFARWANQRPDVYFQMNLLAWIADGDGEET
jgi:hypothetical protein